MSAANYALCDSCDGKVFYVGEMDVPLNAVVTHVDCQLKELAKVRAEAEAREFAALRAERDEARAELADAMRDAEGWAKGRAFLAMKVAQAEAEVLRLRPVFEAAKAWREPYGEDIEPWEVSVYEHALIAAVDQADPWAALAPDQP